MESTLNLLESLGRSRVYQAQHKTQQLQRLITHWDGNMEALLDDPAQRASFRTTLASALAELQETLMYSTRWEEEVMHGLSLLRGAVHPEERPESPRVRIVPAPHPRQLPRPRLGTLFDAAPAQGGLRRTREEMESDPDATDASSEDAVVPTAKRVLRAN